MKQPGKRCGLQSQQSGRGSTGGWVDRGSAGQVMAAPGCSLTHTSTSPKRKPGPRKGEDNGHCTEINGEGKKQC